MVENRLDGQLARRYCFYWNGWCSVYFNSFYLLRFVYKNQFDVDGSCVWYDFMVYAVLCVQTDFAPYPTIIRNGYTHHCIDVNCIYLIWNLYRLFHFLRLP